jgi:nicotinamide mononucleotide (NMN) deamidase PncC
LKHDGPGTVSLQTAEALAKRVRLHSDSIIGLAETGMLPSNFESRRTRKREGEAYLAINTASKSSSKELEIQKNLSRILMRQAITWEILKEFENFLRQNIPK